MMMRKRYLIGGLTMLFVAISAFTVIGHLGELLVGEVVQNVGIGPEPEHISEVASPVMQEVFAPDWEMTDLDNNLVHLSDFRGQPVVMTFWTTWNALATDQVHILDTLQGDGISHVLAVNSQEERGAVANFIRRGGYHLQVLVDETGSVTASYGARVLPATFFIDRDGNIKSMFVGPLSESMLRDRIQQIVP